MSRLPAQLLALSLLVAATACFHYVPVEQAPARGTPVRVDLGRPLPVQLQEITANNVDQVRGEVVSADDGRLVLSVFGLRLVGGTDYIANGETLIVPDDAVASLQEKRLSPLRTAIASALVVGAGVLVERTWHIAVGGGDTSGGTGVTR